LIQDAELEVNWIDITPFTKAAISAQLEDMCTKYKTKKIQLQDTGSESNRLTYLSGQAEAKNLTTRYELVVKCKNIMDVKLFEYLFSEKGIHLESSEIVFKNSSNLEY